MGRLKCGEKTESAAKTRETWRITSNDRDALETLRQKYGGTITEIKDRKAVDRWDLSTETDRLEVALPPDPVDITRYELWGGSGLVRSCDTQTCMIAPTRDNPMETVSPCICTEIINAVNNGERKPPKPHEICGLKTRMKVMLPEVALGGVWLVTSGSESASYEWPTMVRLIEEARQHSGISLVDLVIDPRSAAGGTKRFVVPTLKLRESLVELMAGHGQLTRAAAIAALQAKAEVLELEQGGESEVRKEFDAIFAMVMGAPGLKDAWKAEGLPPKADLVERDMPRAIALLRGFLPPEDDSEITDAEIVEGY